MGRSRVPLRDTTVPMLTKHSACSPGASRNSARRLEAFRALPLVSAEPYPWAVAMSSMFWMAQPADTMRSASSMSASPRSPSTMASSNTGER